jgi:hypothetical protein
VSAEILAIETRLLLAKHGLEPILRELATAENVTIEELRARIEQIRERRSRPRPKPISSAVELVDAKQLSQSEKSKFRILAERFDSRRFLPNLRDVTAFLRRHGIERKKLKSRAVAFPLILKVISTIPDEEFVELLADAESSDEGDYALLAKKIIGNSGGSPQ